MRRILATVLLAGATLAGPVNPQVLPSDPGVVPRPLLPGIDAAAAVRGVDAPAMWRTLLLTRTPRREPDEAVSEPAVRPFFRAAGRAPVPVDLRHVSKPAGKQARPALPALSTTHSSGPATGMAWGPEIVFVDNPGSQGCTSPRIPECMQARGASPQAVAFARHWGQGWATDFRDLGAVDLVDVFSPLRLNANESRVLVLPDGRIHELPFPPALAGGGDASSIDRVSRRVLAAMGDVFVHPFFVTGHRSLPDGRQRFVYTAVLTDGSRAGAALAMATVSVDAGPRGLDLPARLLTVEPLAFDGPDNGPGTSHTDLMTRPARLQSALNQRGYPAGPVDGILGQLSRGAWADFQRDHGLPATGQIDVATARALADSDALAPAPCAGAAPGPGGSALLPFAPGTFATDPRLCGGTLDQVAFESDVQIGEVIRFTADEVSRGASVCRIDRSRFRNHLLSLDASCIEEGMGPFRRELGFHSVGRHSFVESFSDEEHLIFLRCDWPIEETTILGLRPGVYQPAPALCGDEAQAGSRRVLSRNDVVFGHHTGCTVDSRLETPQGIRYRAVCRDTVLAYDAEWVWQADGTESFVEHGLSLPDTPAQPQRFSRCPDDGPEVSAPLVPPIGETVDLFNLPSAILDSGCAEDGCTLDLVAGRYQVRPLAGAPPDTSAILRQCEVFFEQNVPVCFPATPDATALAGRDLFGIEQIDCGQAPCPVALFAEDPEYSNDPTSSSGSYSGPGGLFLDLRPGTVLTAAPAALTSEDRAFADAVLAAYGGDRTRMETVADHAEHALLSWAAYGSDTAIQAAAARGWQAAANVADPAATLFAHPDGRRVLAFRGNGIDADWTAGQTGVALPTPLTTAQVQGAITLARQSVAQHPDILFTGHALGGRLAQLARLTTQRPAVVFNAAPLFAVDGADRLVTRAVQRLLEADRQAPPLVRFRGRPDLPRTQVLWDWIEVPDIGAQTPGPLPEPGGAVDARLLADAMMRLRSARDQGWLDR